MQHRPSTRDFRAELARYLDLALPDSPDEVILRVHNAEYCVRLIPVHPAAQDTLFAVPASVPPVPPAFLV